MQATGSRRFTPTSRVVLTVSILAALSSGSCSTSDEGGHYHTVADLHVIHADGTGDRVLAAGDSYDALLLGDSTFIVHKEITGLCRGSYTGSSIAQLYSGIPWMDCSISTDRTRVVLTTNPGAASANDVYMMNADGTNLIRCGTAAGEYNQARISPALDEIVFQRLHAVGTMGPDGGNLRFVDSSSGPVYMLQPLYIDENRILYSVDSTSAKGANGEVGTTSLVLYDKRNHARTLLVAQSQLFYYGQNMVRGDTLLCSDYGTIKFVDLRSGLVTTEIPGPGISASFSPDGSKMLYTEGRHVYVRDLRSGSTAMIYTNADNSRTIASTEMSPDGRFIVMLVTYSAPG